MIDNPLVSPVVDTESDDNLISVDDLMADVNSQPDDNTSPEFAHLSRAQLEAALLEAESKRRGFQSEADRAKAEAMALKQVYESHQGAGSVTQPQPKPTAEAEPKPEDFLKDIDPEDFPAVMTANSKYLEARQNYLIKQQTKIIREELKQEAERDKLMAQAQVLASRDARFRLPDGTPNLKAIDSFLTEATSDWSKLYDQLNSQSQSQAQQQAVSQPGIKPSGFPKTLAGVGGASVSQQKKLPDELARIQNAFGHLDLPPGAYIKRR